MSTERYFPATETENVGISSHEDSNLISLILQDQVGGLEVLKDGLWIPVVPSPTELVVNLGDIIQARLLDFINTFSCYISYFILYINLSMRIRSPAYCLPKMNIVISNV